ncbi:hypothetical protein, partial [Streptomyces sp. NPDC002402]
AARTRPPGPAARQRIAGTAIPRHGAQDLERARLLLVELRDEQGNPTPGDGIPFRTELGKTVAEDTATLEIA